MITSKQMYKLADEIDPEWGSFLCSLGEELHGRDFKWDLQDLLTEAGLPTLSGDWFVEDSNYKAYTRTFRVQCRFMLCEFLALMLEDEEAAQS